MTLADDGGARRTGSVEEEFWERLADGGLPLRRCRRCGLVIWYPRAVCPDCQSTDGEWLTARGSGVVNSATVVHRADGEFREATPFVLALIELDEGPGIFARVVGTAAEAPEVGVRVDIVAPSDRSESGLLPAFAVTSQEGGRG